MSREVKILSCGAGVNSTALLLLRKQGKIEFDYVVFADTGCEHPETYAYIDSVIKPLCAEMNLPFEIVKREGKNLYDFYYERQIIPSRWLRSCTYKFKLDIIIRHCKEKFGKEFRSVAGIDYGERDRAHGWGKDTDFPLIELGLNRVDCERIIKNAKLPLPRKSGCFICAYTTNREWFKLLKEHPDLYDKAQILEKNGRRYPEFLFRTIPLEKLRKRKTPPKETDPQKSMCGFIEKCVVCHE